MTIYLPDALARLYAFGAESGYNTEGDVLVNQSADGVDLNAIWEQAATALSMWNAKRSALASLLSYGTIASGDAMPQTLEPDNFELASEFGEPHGLKAESALILGYDFKDFDLASRFTWRYLRNASAEQVRGTINRAMEADNRLITGTILRRLFDPAEGANEHMHRVFGLWNGTDGMTPPPYAGQSFVSTDSHYLVSNNSALDPGDLLDAINQVRAKGFGVQPNSRLLVLAHPDEADTIATFKEGVDTNGVESRHDFVPSLSAPAFMTEETIVGQQAPGDFAGLEVLGSYGPAWVIGSYFLPKGYIAVVATGGPGSTLNPIGFREHTNPAYRGLRIIPGRDQRYPLQDSFFQRSFGVGVRYRGAACVVQIKASGSYTAPQWAWT